MIDWLLQSSAAHPAIAQGIAPEGLLSPAEAARLATMPVAKRRRDWLLGRWTAKRLLQERVARRAGVLLPFSAFTIASDPDGAPRVIVDSLAAPGIDALGSLPVSISHSNGQAFCGLHAGPGTLGVDIERIEPRAPEFAQDYFTTPELAQLHAAPPSQRDLLTTLIWSAKEAALKSLRLGLTVDTRSVSCAPAEGYGPSWGWGTLGVTSTLQAAGAGFAGWWRTVGEYVLTVVILAS